jgi:amidase
VSRSVRDSAALLDTVHGAVPGDQYWAPAPENPYITDAIKDPGTLQIAYSVHDYRGERVHPQVEAAILDTVDLLESLGHKVTQDAPLIDGDILADAFLDWWAALASLMFKTVLDVAAERPAIRRMRTLVGDYKTMQAISKTDSRTTGKPAFEPFTWTLARRAMAQRPADLIAASAALQDIAHTTGWFLERYDMALTPVLAGPPLKIGALDQTLPYDTFAKIVTRYVAFTPLANVTGFPAMSVPLSWTPQGLPIGSQFLAGFGDESTLIRLAGQLERARPWAQKRPPIV